MRVAESRMGYSSQRQQPLGVNVVGRLLALIREEAEDCSLFHLTDGINCLHFHTTVM